MAKPGHLKILIIGDCGVGKSSILNSFIYENFNPEIQSTITYDFHKSSVEIDGQMHDLAIWDTAGVEKHHALMPIFYRGCHGVILVYDVTAAQSFDNISDWSSNVDTYSRQSNVVKMLVGNKIDEPVTAVNREQAKEFARRSGMLFLETSAKTRENVDNAFRELVRKIVESPHYQQTRNTNGISLNGPRSPDDSSYSSYCGC
ncbi:Ras- protein Rab-18 [Cichlidogyrus casuarinus]|uniref:Ras- protein Rab-18 n=1 Tax=Cichlidogyrus casuarinus TaxID=1844966 RepID=A0ABD2PT99_9PLAT